ncbi:MAG: T9SS type A sorting domain-containing protein [Saprospiraceae bacterium]
MKILFTLLILFGSLQAFAQNELTLSCPDPVTVACIDAIPAPDLAQLVAQTDCGVDYNGNPIDTASTGGPRVCDTAYVACYYASVANISTLDNGDKRVEIEITYGTQEDCKHAVSHVAFSLPDGVKAVEFDEKDSYTGLLGSYNVENTTNNPYYSIKFESDDDGFEPGTKEIFAYTIPAGVEYNEVEILVKAATNRDEMTLSLICTSGPATPIDTVINYETFWIYDYIEPGGTGCIGDPIIVTRSFGASDACYNSSSCNQEFYIESECINGIPMGCGTDTMQILGRTALPSFNIWQPEQQSYAVKFSGYEEHEGGYYSISEIWQPEGSSAIQRELGRMPPIWQEEYSFAHESIEPTDSIRVEWIGRSVEASITTTVNIRNANVHPNPGTDAFTLTLPETLGSNARVFVYDQIGRLQQERSVSTNRNSIQLNGEQWTSGLYRIQVISDTGVVYQATWMKR